MKIIDTYPDSKAPGDYVVRLMDDDDVLVVTFSGMQCAKRAEEYCDWIAEKFYARKSL